MGSVALANALKDFGEAAPAASEAFLDTRSFPALPEMNLEPMPTFPAVEPVDVDALIAEAVAAAEEQLSDKLAGEHAASLQAERDRHEQDIAELHQQFAEEASTKVLAAVVEMEERLVELTGSVTARILGNFLTEDIRTRSLQKLADLIKDALTDGETARIRAQGSLSFFQALTDRLPGYADQLAFTESPNFDLTVTIDDSVYETRLAEWSAALAEALAE